MPRCSFEIVYSCTSSPRLKIILMQEWEHLEKTLLIYKFCFRKKGETCPDAKFIQQKRGRQIPILNFDFQHKCFPDHSQSDSLLLESTNACLFPQLSFPRSRFDECRLVNRLATATNSLRICQSTQFLKRRTFCVERKIETHTNTESYLSSQPQIFSCANTWKASSFLPLHRARQVTEFCQLASTSVFDGRSEM